jgi:hypothetical protein
MGDCPFHFWQVVGVAVPPERRDIIARAMTRRLVAVILLVFSAVAPAQIRYAAGTWDKTRYGNRRAVVRVSTPADAVLAHVEWRRRDAEPGRKKIVVVDAATGNRLGNVVTAAATREAGDIVFQPLTVPGNYYIYYTVRELSNRAPELFALRSLGDEVFLPSPGGGFSWLQEHLGGNYIAGWLVPDLEDAAVVNSGVSRWHNYYVEGLNWLVKNAGIDGL